MEVAIGRIGKEFTWLGVVYERRNRDSMTPHDPNVGFREERACHSGLTSVSGF